MIVIDKFINCIITFGKIQNFIIQNKTLQIENLRKFHNFIKLNLILDACKRTNAKNLLDIACGRGGDLQKWINNINNLTNLLKFDQKPPLNELSVKETVQGLSNPKRQNPSQRFCQFNR